MSERGLVYRSAAGSAVVAIMLFVLLVSFAPDATWFSPNNYGWNGIQGVASIYPLQFTSGVPSIPTGKNAVLIIMQPVNRFSQPEAQDVRNFVTRGGTVIVADGSGVSNSLLREMNLGVTIQDQYAVHDPAYNWRAQALPIALVVPSSASQFRFLADVKGIALVRPSPLEIQSGSGARRLAITSPLSLELARNSSALELPMIGPSPNVIAKGPFVVAAAQRIGNGTIIVVGDSQFFTNSVWTTANDGTLIANLLSGATVYLDTSHWQASPVSSSIARLKAEFGALYVQLSQFPLRYLLTLAFVAVAVAIVPLYSGITAESGKVASDGDVLTAFDSEVLERVRKDRERYGKPE